MRAETPRQVLLEQGQIASQPMVGKAGILSNLLQDLKVGCCCACENNMLMTPIPRESDPGLLWSFHILSVTADKGAEKSQPY